MFGAMLSALYSVLAWVVRSVLVKFAVYFALYFVTTEFVDVARAWLPDGHAVSNAFADLPSSMWFFLNLFSIPQGVQMILAAYVTRFTIRRIPIIG